MDKGIIFVNLKGSFSKENNPLNCMKIKLLIYLSAIFLGFIPKKSPKFKITSPFRKMFIGAKTVDCSGDGKYKCMMVKDAPEKNWEFFYDSIEGFRHEQGFEYQILIEIVNLPQESKDGAFVKYILRRVISKIPVDLTKSNTIIVPPPVLPPTKSRATEWILTDFIYQDNGMEAKDFDASITMDFAQKKVFGQGPCNRYFGTLRDLENNQVRFENIGNTKSICDFSDKEKAFFRLLPLSNNYVIEGARMYIFRGTELLLAFKRK